MSDIYIFTYKYIQSRSRDRRATLVLVVKAVASTFGALQLLEMPMALLMKVVSSVDGKVPRRWNFGRKVEFVQRAISSEARAQDSVGGLAVGDLVVSFLATC